MSKAVTSSAPFAFFGEGFALFLACVPRLTVEYHQNRPRLFSAAAADSPPRTVNAIDRVVARFDTQGGSEHKPLDFKDVRDAAIEATKTAEKLTILLERTNDVVGSGVWDERLSRLDRATSGVVDRAFWRGLLLVLVLLGGLALIRLLPQRARASATVGGMV